MAMFSSYTPQQTMAQQGRKATQVGNYGGGTGHPTYTQPAQPAQPAAAPAPKQVQDNAFSAWGTQGQRQTQPSKQQAGRPADNVNVPNAGQGSGPQMGGGQKTQGFNPFSGFQGNQMGTGPGAPGAMMGPGVGGPSLSSALQFNPNQPQQKINPTSGASSIGGAPTDLTIYEGARPNANAGVQYAITGSGGNTTTGGNAVDPTSGNTGGQPGANTYYGSDPNAAYTPQGRESSGNPLDDLLSTLGDVTSDWNGNRGIGGLPTGPLTPGNLSNHPLQDAGYGAGRLAGAFPSGMADAINEYSKEGLNKYFDNFQDTQNIYDAGQGLLDPARQAEADAAERQQLQAQIASERDDAMRRLQGQAGRGGVMGTGAQTGVLNSALRAQAEGSNKLAQDQYQRMMGRTQLGGSLMSDATRQKYGIMNDGYTSGGQLAALLMEGGQGAVDVLNKMPGSKSPWSMLG